MRFLLLFVLALQVISFPVEQDGSGLESSGCKCSCPEELPPPTTQAPARSPARKKSPESSLNCPDGWIRYQQSCYFLESEKLDLTSAERKCNEKGATLFVADSIEEFVSVIWRFGFLANEVMKETPTYFWSWIGLGQGATDTYPKWHVASAYLAVQMHRERRRSAVVGGPVWHGSQPTVSAPCSLWVRSYMRGPFRKWLVTPFSSSVNGWSAAATCVAYYNMDTYSSTYVYFYPCSSLFHSVCERNSTLMHSV
ncbi:unnamed protein product [Heligmosomoides polygyrus]|uniref:C-type lectin domain-containing protein n=1 Tax=Heligmosomoides polygyrus TaxID=6339 RepID=A0A3P8BDR5_HELPZ|nr:unnamed protein product [Heligmosomoides polygyrus]